MKFEEIPKEYQIQYDNQCHCGRKHIVFTQTWQCPEYDTAIYIQCDCGDYVSFILPVM